MFLKVASRSVATVDNFPDNMQEGMKDISGFCAGICYSDGYDEDSIDEKLSSIESNIKRHNKVIGTMHHSISDHPVVTVYLGGISKMMAMILNSLEFYTTSERSARYTKVLAERPEEQELYDKWKDIIYERIKEVYPNIDDKRREKLSMENARYFLSVMNRSTSMAYTTSYRQWSYIVQWFDKFIEENKDDKSYFCTSIKDEMMELSELILKNGIGTYDIKDTKDRHIRFLQVQTNDPSLEYRESFSDMYLVRYDCSLACLAQAQRHRTLRYSMNFDGYPKYFFVPEILTDEQKIEWVDDMRFASKWIPQGTLVHVTESGYIDDFLMKCKERLCGRAQFEVAMSTADTMNRLFINGEGNRDLSDCYIRGERLKAKCELVCGGCKEPCEFGAVHALDRSI